MGKVLVKYSGAGDRRICQNLLYIGHCECKSKVLAEMVSLTAAMMCTFSSLPPIIDRRFRRLVRRNLNPGATSILPSSFNEWKITSCLLVLLILVVFTNRFSWWKTVRFNHISVYQPCTLRFRRHLPLPGWATSSKTGLKPKVYYSLICTKGMTRKDNKRYYVHPVRQ